MRSEKERASRVIFELEEGSVDCVILIGAFCRSKAGSRCPMDKPR